MSKRYPGGIIRKTPQTPSQTSAQGIWDMASVTQAVKENTWPIAGVPDPISKSLRFRSSASAYMNRTFTSSGNTQKFTQSIWCKRGTLGAYQTIGYTFFTGTYNGQMRFNSNDTLDIYVYYDGSSYTGQLSTTQVFRDPSAWYHFVLAVDTTQSTASNRIKFYVNGVQVTAFGTANYPNQNQALLWNASGNTGYFINAQQGSTYFFDGYITELNYIDGQALTPSSFGSTNDQTGVWQPIAYTGTYGTNGFYLPFSNTASTSTLGNDFSGNSNNWTTNNISLTSGTTYDSMNDVPTQWIPYNTAGDVGALWRGNYCTFNPLQNNGTLTNGNLTLSTSTSTTNVTAGTIGVSSGKWYWEWVASSNGGIASIGISLYPGTTVLGDYYLYQADTGNKDSLAGVVSYGATYTTGDVMGVALDLDNGTLTFYKNNTSQGVAYTSLPSGTYFAQITDRNVGGVLVGDINFGQRPFSYTPPSGFKTLNTTNLPTPTIGATASTQANDYFNPVLYTGNGTTNAITGVGFQPDFVWLKGRSDALFNGLYDAVRGAGSTKGLYSNDTVAEGTYFNFQNLISFDSNGFTLGATVNTNNINLNAATFVGWNWKANGAGSTNTAGTITSTVSASTASGFSIVTYTGNGTNGSTVGHGLGVTPGMVIVKSRTSANDWAVYHSGLTAGNMVFLNTTGSSQTITTYDNGGIYPVSSSTFTTAQGGITQNNVNGSGITYVAYCFAEVAGYSKIGSYVGNDSADGTFIYTGFRPAFILYKKATGTDGWVIFDTKRNTYNVVDSALQPNTSGAEASSAAGSLDIVSNGFKQRNANNIANSSSFTYIYMAFAEFPFKFSLAR